MRFGELMTNKRGARICLALASCAFSAGCTDASFLDTGDVLIASFEPGFLYVHESGTADCNGGAKVLLSARHGDGTAAHDATVQLWLTGSATATLSKESVTLSTQGADESACLTPGPAVGTTTLHARSGAVETSQTIDVRDRTVPSGGMLTLGVSPISFEAPPPSACGMPATGCGSSIRQAAVAIQASGTDSSPVPAGAVVGLATSIGSLSTSPCAGATSGSLQNLLSATLASGQAGVFVCFDDSGGAGMLTARSGSITASAPLTLRPVLRGVTFDPDRTAAKAGDKVTFSGFALDCSGQGIAGVPVALQIEVGSFVLNDGTTVIAKTATDGSVTYSGTVGAVPLRARLGVLGASQVSCESSIASAP
ncbi:MAG: hypothetical protein JWO36_3358 [Myxococcales bacterium]|nr:hypothetical protein [Myxococcales bacterium]